MPPLYCIIRQSHVAPFAGAWIEIAWTYEDFGTLTSLPSRERGLKWSNPVQNTERIIVAPFAGAWIEIRLYVAHYDFT